MKLIFLAVFSSLLSCAVLTASPLDPKGNAKITKNEAEHIALKGYPGARVTAANLQKMDGKLVWLIAIAQPDAQPIAPVAVDAMTGRIAAKTP